MTMNFAIVESNEVSNLVVWDGESDWTPPEGAVVIPLTSDIQVGVGWAYNGSEFVPPTNVSNLAPS